VQNKIERNVSSSLKAGEALRTRSRAIFLVKEAEKAFLRK
jgi:hypothetical protein